MLRLAVGYSHLCGLLEGGVLYCAGDPPASGLPGKPSVPTLLDVGGPVVQIDAGNNHT